MRATESTKISTPNKPCTMAMFSSSISYEGFIWCMERALTPFTSHLFFNAASDFGFSLALSAQLVILIFAAKTFLELALAPSQVSHQLWNAGASEEYHNDYEDDEPSPVIRKDIGDHLSIPLFTTFLAYFVYGILAHFGHKPDLLLARHRSFCRANGNLRAFLKRRSQGALCDPLRGVLLFSRRQCGRGGIAFWRLINVAVGRIHVHSVVRWPIRGARIAVVVILLIRNRVAVAVVSGWLVRAIVVARIQRIAQLGGIAPKLAHSLAKLPQYFRQLVRPKNDQQHNRHGNELYRTI